MITAIFFIGAACFGILYLVACFGFSYDGMAAAALGALICLVIGTYRIIEWSLT